MKLLRRNLSLMLAVRYLNPLRTMFSIITLICLGGVALGVMVLIVVLSVMEGLQKEIEDKALAFAPHYTIYLGTTAGVPADGQSKWSEQRLDLKDYMCDWKGILEGLRKDGEVVCAYPLVEGEAFAENNLNNGHMMVHFTALQMDNDGQLAPIREMLKEGDLDFGDNDDKCIISEETAQQLGLRLHDKIHLSPVGNLDELANTYAMVQKPFLTREDEAFEPMTTNLFVDAQEDAEGNATVEQGRVEELLGKLISFLQKTNALRERERELCIELYQLLAQHADTPTFSAEEREQWESTKDALFSLDQEVEDGKALKNSVTGITMPKNPEIVGIYRAPENIAGPNVYMPLRIAQEMLHMEEDDKVMAICVRVKDIHQDTGIEARIMQFLPAPHTFPLKPLPAEDTSADDRPPLEDIEIVEDGEATAMEPAGTPQPAEAVEAGQQQASEADAIETGGTWYIAPWTKSFEKWSKLIADERTMMSFVLSIISLIASFCIMAVMFTMSIQRKREIAVLQALGATPGKIMGIFAWQGFIIGLVGSLLGIGLALLVLHYRLELQAVLAGVGMDPFPMQAHGISLPANYDPVTFTKQAVSAFVMVMIAAIIPAFIVSRQDPAKALRSN